MQYRVIQKGDAAKLAEAVTAALAEGWRLYGGLVVAMSGHFTVFAQALVKDC